ncbi:MAG: hypothetical protein V1701_04485 [Planctomycetota bacterium]
MEKRKPDEVTSYEFLAEHLYDFANKGGYEKVFNLLRGFRIFRPFHSLRHLIVFVQTDGKRIKGDLCFGLVALWQRYSDAELRPALVTTLLVVLWQNLSDAYERYAELTGQIFAGNDRLNPEIFGEIYWAVFEFLQSADLLKLQKPGALIQSLTMSINHKLNRLMETEYFESTDGHQDT